MFQLKFFYNVPNKHVCILPKKEKIRTYLAVQGLVLHTSTAEGHEFDP